MKIEELKAKQKAERDRCLQVVLQSKSKKKIIVAGPGTGKTFTFGKVLELKRDGNNIAMTFIRKLADDMNSSLGELAEVKTFHAYCKKVLHEQNGRVDLVPCLSQVIGKDAEVLDENVSDFDEKFQELKEDSPDIAFYLSRGDYYEVVSFNDSVYRLYRALKENGGILPDFDQILVDEFQDFNALEVAFIGELEKKGAILIVGDDDQAIYDDRFASPSYLRDKLKSGEYENFELPFCGRCPEAIVNATNSIIKAAQELGCLSDVPPS
jgi:superfamily I DNA/RNA helicase